MKKAFVTMTTVAVIGFGSLFLGDSVHADSLSQIQDQRSSIKANLSVAEGKLADVLLDLHDLNEQIDRVDTALAENKKLMDDTKDKLESTKAEIENLKDEIKELEDNIAKRYEILKDRIVALQQNGGDIGYLEVVFGSQNFGDFISRVSAVSKIAESDQNLMERQKEDKAKLEEKQKSVKEKLSNLKDMKSELEGMQGLILEQKKQNDARKAELESKKQELSAIKANLQAKDNNLAATEAKIRRSIANLNSGGSTPTNHSHASSPAASPAPTPAASGDLSTVIHAGYKYIGNSAYKWAGGRTAYDVAHGLFDCSGFVSWAYSQAGISIPRSTAGLSGYGKAVSYSNAKPGDLIFFDTYKRNGHVGIYIGNGKFIGSQSSSGISIERVKGPYWRDVFSGHVRRIVY